MYHPIQPTRLYLLLCLCLGLCCNYAYGQSKYKDYYRFNFSPRQEAGRDWLSNSMYAGQAALGFPTDSSALFHFMPYPLYQRLRAEIGQRILLPKEHGKMAKVSLLGTGENIRRLVLKLTTIDETENILHTSEEVLSAPSNAMAWQEATIPLTGGSLLDIAIYAEGNEGQSAHMVFRRIDVCIDGVSIADQAVPQLSTPSLPTASPYSQARGSLFDNGQEPWVVGFGEAVHKNSLLRGLMHENILRWVREGKTRFVLLERPMAQAVAYDRYVHTADYVLDDHLLDVSTQCFFRQPAPI